MVLHFSLVYSNPFYCVQQWNEPKRDQRKIMIRKFWMSPNGKHEECVVLCLRCHGLTACMCGICVCTFSHVSIHVNSRRPVRWCLCMCTFTLPHVYMKAHVCECDSVCEPVGSLPVVCSRRYAYGKTETSSGAPLPLPLLWWKAALIEWPGTQTPFLIITAVQSLLITLKVCRAPHSPVMLQAIRESERKIRRFWQNPLSKKLKGWKRGPTSNQCSSPLRLISFSI